MGGTERGGGIGKEGKRESGREKWMEGRRGRKGKKEESEGKRAEMRKG